MKKLLVLPIFILLLGCSKDDDVVEDQEEFLMAQVDGEEYFVGGSNSIIECKKYLSGGSVNLAVKVSTEEGRTIEFFIPNYRGPSTYDVVNQTYFFKNGNWMKYVETLPEGVWSTTQNELISNRATLEVTGDTGTTINGTFSFDAQAELGESIRSISEGNFLVRID